MEPDFERMRTRKEVARNWSEKVMPGAVKKTKEGMFDARNYDPFEPDDYRKFIRDYVGQRHGDFQSKTFVDVGAGTGSCLHDAVSSLGAKIINVDISPHAVKYLEEQQGQKGAVGDAFMLPFADNSIDGVLSSNFINSEAMGRNLDDYEMNVAEFMKEVLRVLKPEGLFIQANFGGGYSKASISKLVLNSIGFSNISATLPSVKNMERFRTVIEKNKPKNWKVPLVFIARKPLSAE